MSFLKVTLMDVGWGDSILIEASDGNLRPRYALIDSNDNAERDYWPTWNFLRKHFGLSESRLRQEKPFFDFVMLTHDHSDHGTGLRRIMQKYGTHNFWYPKVDLDNSSVLTSLIAYADHGRVNIDNQAIDNEIDIGNLGDVRLNVLWPPPDTINADPNNNSIVLTLTLDGVSFLLTGDAEGEVWQQIADQIPSSTRMVKVPHHGSRNGTINHGAVRWVERIDNLPIAPHLGISCHPNFPNRFNHPHSEVLERFAERPYPCYRTDQHYHTTFIADDDGVRVKYSHS